MEVSQTINLYITFVEKEGPFLKVWGQTEKNNSIYVEQFLLGASPQFELGVGKVLLENLQVGTLVCAKYKDNKYYRARITNVAFLVEGFVEVSFLDFGNKDIVPSGNIRSLQNFPSSFISIPPLATGFIFAEAHCPGGGEWNDTIFENISKEIKYREVQCTLLIQATQYFLIKIFIGSNDLCSMLISRGFMQPISLQAQQAVLLSMSMQRPSIPLSHSAAPPSTGINTYKACTLEPGCQYPVYVSYVNDGPCHFSVQLKQSEDVLVMLMNDINTITLRLLEDIPIPGTICLSRCQEDGNICRAVVTNEVDNQFKVFYVDFGNYEVVPLDALYQIPFKYVLPKVMAIRFSLAGVEKSTVTLEMQCAFKQFVDNRLLHMKVLPTPTRTAIPKCELWDPETKTSALDVVNRAARHAYPEPISLNRGFSQPVKVSYVFSCNRFYVQLANKENELLKLMLDLQSSCQANDIMDPGNIKIGLPCCALFESDQQWYRSQIVEVLGENVKVRYIDYGNEELVPISQLKIIDGEQLTVLRPQAIECCLNGYQNMSEDDERDGILEGLILEGLFTMKVVEMTNKKALVELFDSSNYNVSSLLLDKLAAAKSQASPMLVQAGNKIEHRKSISQQRSPRDQNFRQDRKPGRDYKNYDRTNDRTEKPWRQDNKDNRNHDKYSNENGNERTSWRDNNKGFSPNSERYNNRDRNRNDRPAKPNFTENENTDNWDAPAANDVTAASNNDWEAPVTDTASGNSRPNKFDRGKGRFENDKENWNSGGQRGGFKKRNDFRKDGSEVSSSGSEKSFHKGPRTSSRNDWSDRPKFQKKFDKPRNAPFNNSGPNDSWNVSAVTSIDAAPVTASFTPYDVVGTESKVIISWFHTPGHFYCQMADVQEQFKSMMDEIQQFYKSRKPETSVAGAPIVGLFPEDNVLYRARVLEVLGSEYKVYYVDFGNVSTINKVWPIEKKFMNLPAQAIICSLSGIGPPDAEWPNADSYSKYFDKDMFVCRFVNKDEEKTYVNLFYGDDDIAQLLVRDGLAISTQNIIPDIEIPLLVGQQFRSVIKSINNLSDIIIALQCGVALSCKVHNLETATETFEDTLKGLLEQTVIVFVDNVIDDRLEVTLYDNEGSKITVINPDEGAFDTVEVLCPPLVLSSILTGYVSHADDTSVYIQPLEYAGVVTSLLDRMFESYDGQSQDLPIIPEEGLLYAVHSGDSNWYRGKVISFDDEKTTVMYVDYGNSENVDFLELRELNDEFLEACTLCVRVSVSSPTENLVDKDVVAHITYGENGWEGTVDLKTPGELSATESSELERGDGVGMTVIEPLKEFNEEVIQEASTEQEIELEKVAIPDVVGDVVPDEVPNSSTESSAIKGIQVLISHVDSPNEFYIQLSESISAIVELQANLQEQALEMPVLENPAAGVLCAAPFSLDQTWYRAEVLDADDDITTVRFIDYGNTDVIDNKTTEIKTLPPNLLSLAVYATRCSLKIQSPDEEWSSNALEAFESLTGAEYVTVEFIDQDEKTNYVELYSTGENVKDLLIKEGLGVPMELLTEGKSTCFVSHLNSPSEFWVQLENCVDELEWIAEQLSGSENFPELEDLTPGTLCAALFPDDQMWYRARILSNTVAGIELLFIDYGNSCMSNSLRQLPEDLVVTQPLAQKCSLQKPDGISYWTPQASSKFSEISADGQTIFTIRKISTGETSVVQLLIDGEDVTTMLRPSTEDGRVVNVEGMEKLSIEKAGEVLPESYQLEAMPGMTWTDESKGKLEELTDQGTTLFQIEFLSENMVRLYLDGNDIRPNLEAVKTVSLNLSKTDDDKDKSDYEIDSTENEAKSKETEIETDITNNDDSVNIVKSLGEDLLENVLSAVEEKLIETEPDNIQPAAVGELEAEITETAISDTEKDTDNLVTNEDTKELQKIDSQTPVLSPSKTTEEKLNVKSLLNEEIEKALDDLDLKHTKSEVSEKEELEDADKTTNEVLVTPKKDLPSHEESEKDIEVSPNLPSPSEETDRELESTDKTPNEEVLVTPKEDLPSHKESEIDNLGCIELSANNLVGKLENPDETTNEEILVTPKKDLPSHEDSEKEDLGGIELPANSLVSPSKETDEKIGNPDETSNKEVIIPIKDLPSHEDSEKEDLGGIELSANNLVSPSKETDEKMENPDETSNKEVVVTPTKDLPSHEGSENDDLGGIELPANSFVSPSKETDGKVENSDETSNTEVVVTPTKYLPSHEDSSSPSHEDSEKEDLGGIELPANSLVFPSKETDEKIENPDETSNKEVVVTPTKDLPSHEDSEKEDLGEIELSANNLVSPSKETDGKIENPDETSNKEVVVIPTKNLPSHEDTEKEDLGEIELPGNSLVSPSKETDEKIENPDETSNKEVVVTPTKEEKENSGDIELSANNFVSPTKKTGEKLEMPDKTSNAVLVTPKKDLPSHEETEKDKSGGNDLSSNKLLSPKKKNDEKLDVNKSLLNEEIEKALDNINTGEDTKSGKRANELVITPKKDVSFLDESDKRVSKSAELSVGTNAEMVSLLHEELEKALDKQNAPTSRPSSRSSGKISFDDRIIPAAVSRPHTPSDDESTELRESTRSRRQSAGSGKINFDERIVPAAVSRPQSPLPATD